MVTTNNLQLLSGAKST